MRILGLYVGDANGDGKNELIVVKEGGLSVYTFVGDGFEEIFSIDAPVLYFNPRSIAVEDVDGDGMGEIVIGYVDMERKIRIEVYKGTELIASIASAVPGGDVEGIFAVDINDDNTTEIVAFGSNSQGFTTMTVRLPTKPKLMRIERIPIGKKVLDCIVGDVDGDGEIEAVVLTEEGIMRRDKGSKRFSKAGIEAYDVSSIELADVNGDLFMELILASRSELYVYAFKELLKQFNVWAEKIIVHDIDNDGTEEIIAFHSDRLCFVDVENERVECKETKRAKYLAAGKFGDKRLIIAADEKEFRIAAEFEFQAPNVIEEFQRIATQYKPLIADYILKIAYGGPGEGLEGEMLKEARKALERGEINKAYRIIYELLEGRVPNPKKASRIAVLLSAYLIKNPTSKLREMLGDLVKKKEEKPKKRVIANPREALERLKRGTATEDDLIAAVSLFLHDPNRIKGKVDRLFETVRKQFGSSAALDVLLSIFPIASKSLRSEILLTIMQAYLMGKISPNEIRSAFKRAARRSSSERDLFQLFADVVLKYGQRGMAALIVALSYSKANPEALKRLIPEPKFSFKLSRPYKLEEIPIPDSRLVPLILRGQVNVVMRGKDISDITFLIQP